MHESMPMTDSGSAPPLKPTFQPELPKAELPAHSGRHGTSTHLATTRLALLLIRREGPSVAHPAVPRPAPPRLLWTRWQGQQCTWTPRRRALSPLRPLLPVGEASRGQSPLSVGACSSRPITVLFHPTADVHSRYRLELEIRVNLRNGTGRREDFSHPRTARPAPIRANSEKLGWATPRPALLRLS